MKNMYRVTRPAWAAMETWETASIYLASLLVGLYGAGGEWATVRILSSAGTDPLWIDRFWWAVDLTVVTAGCRVLIWGYRRLRVSSYPSTFVYSFNLPEESTQGGNSQVVGYFHIIPDMESGEITAEGASFNWEFGELSPDSRVGFRSTQVRSTEAQKEITCHIRYDINDEDSWKRHYQQGLLQFRLATPTRVVQSGEDDVYAGYLHSTHKESDSEDVEVQSKGLAKWCCKGLRTERDVISMLMKEGNALFDRLDEMLSARPLPTLWRTKEQPYKNIWEYQIPTPQTVILNPQLESHIDAFLGKVLALSGLDNRTIEPFKRYARTKARLAIDTSAYEQALKTGLAGKTQDWKKYDALTQRAKLICNQITPFLDGDSLLDIGCGNGLIASLLRSHFKRVQLLDVVQYVPAALDLDFLSYKEGQALPTSELFDTVLLLTVLHHSSNPIDLLRRAWKATNKRLIVIESVVGVHEPQLPAKYELLGSSDEDQIAYAAFIDWFYNRVLHDNVPVPYNFTTPEKWQSIFLENKMPLVQTKHFGQDIDLGPEYHILFVLEKPTESRKSAA